MASDTFALRYMSRFRCIAERCEDTCCSGLKIPVSAGRYALLRAALEQEPGEDRLPLVVLNPAPEEPRRARLHPRRRSTAEEVKAPSSRLCRWDALSAYKVAP